MLRYNRRLKPLARNLRSGMTDAEQRLWSRLRRKQILDVQFYRQKPLGEYIVDFYAPAAGLVIEVDGGQHFEAEQVRRDEIRTAYLQAQSLRVLHFTDWEVLREEDAVLEVIFAAVQGSRESQ